MKKNVTIASMLIVMCLHTIAVTVGDLVSTSHDTLVELTTIIPDIVLDIKYATPDNFTKKVLYTSNRCFAIKEVATSLADVQQELKMYGLGLKIFDVLRPLSAQKKMWEICPDEKYVTNPAKGGRHTRGTAVDCTLIDLATGKPLDMGTDFDEMSEKSWRTCTTLSANAQKNRKILEDVMRRHHFTGIQSEWWHFDYNNWQSYPVLDINIETLS